MSPLEIAQYFEVCRDAANYNIIDNQEFKSRGPDQPFITIRHLRVEKKRTDIVHPLSRMKRKAQDTRLSSHPYL
jgi:hypothetical protein